MKLNPVKLVFLIALLFLLVCVAIRINRPTPSPVLPPPDTHENDSLKQVIAGYQQELLMSEDREQKLYTKLHEISNQVDSYDKHDLRQWIKRYGARHHLSTNTDIQTDDQGRREQPDQ